MATYRNPGEAIDFTLTSAQATTWGITELAAGAIVVIKNLIGVVKKEIAAGDTGALHTVGVYELSTAEIDGTASAVELGESVELNTAAANIYVCDDPYDDVIFGTAVADGDSDTNTVKVALIQRAALVDES